MDSRTVRQSATRKRAKRRGWTPFAGPQLAAFLADGKVDEIGFGGAGGGGKTDLELGLALLKHRRTVIYRRTFPQLAGIIERSREVFGAKGRYNESGHFWRVVTRCDVAGRPAPPVKRFVQFRSMPRLEDREKERGTPFDARIWDEAQNFLKEQFLFAKAWTRTSVRGQHTLDLLCFNPPTSPEGLWLIDYFAPWLDNKHAEPAAPGEVRWFVTMPDGKEVEVPGCHDLNSADYCRPADIVTTAENGTVRTLTPRSRTFFPARVTDNPVYMETGYMAVLDALPEPLRSQMRDGDFSAGIEDDAWQVIPTAWVRAAQARWEAMQGVPPPGVPLSGLGVDVARGGKDKTVLQPRYGAFFPRPQVHPGTATPDGKAVGGLVARLLADVNAPQGFAPNVDVIGVGASVYDHLRGQTPAIPARGVNFAAGSHRRDRSGKLTFANLRAEAYWKLREALEPDRGENLCLPSDRELLAELCAVRWSLGASGILMEPKDEVIKRLGRSPDKADALALAHYQPATVGTIHHPFGGG
ncbi:MAG: terminase [Armatimonadetes bacterium]|nr:terminase [Armatimonadota bacterium]